MPSTAGATEDLVSSIERQIHSKTYGRVRDLRVEITGHSVVLYGRVPTYHTKQLAQQGALEIFMTQPVVNAIEVG
jgi:hypothetical protein